jgi:hypothetical protein
MKPKFGKMHIAAFFVLATMYSCKKSGNDTPTAPLADISAELILKTYAIATIPGTLLKDTVVTDFTYDDQNRVIKTTSKDLNNLSVVQSGLNEFKFNGNDTIPFQRDVYENGALQYKVFQIFNGNQILKDSTLTYQGGIVVQARIISYTSSSQKIEHNDIVKYYNNGTYSGLNNQYKYTTQGIINDGYGNVLQWTDSAFGQTGFMYWGQYVKTYTNSQNPFYYLNRRGQYLKITDSDRNMDVFYRVNKGSSKAVTKTTAFSDEVNYTYSYYPDGRIKEINEAIGSIQQNKFVIFYKN